MEQQLRRRRIAEGAENEADWAEMNENRFIPYFGFKTIESRFREHGGRRIMVSRNDGMVLRPLTRKSIGKGTTDISSSIKMKIRIWLRWPELLVIFTFGLVFSKGLMTFVLDNGLMTFLTDSWNLKLKAAVTIVNLQADLRDMLQIYVALCIDVYLGYRWMLILSSLLYSAGLFLLAFSVPQYLLNKDICRPPKLASLEGSKLKTKEVANYCFKKLKHTYFWEGLALLIVGAAAQVIPLDSLSFDQTRVLKPPQDSEPTRDRFGSFSFNVHIAIGRWRQLQQRVIRWFCYGFSILGSIISVYGFISANKNWHRRFLTSAILMFIGLLWFLCGFPFYGPRELQTSPVWTMVRTVIVAMRKRHLNYQENKDNLHRGDGDNQKQCPTSHLEMLNKAAVKESAAADDKLATGEHKWRVCTVKEVEETKLLLDMIPMSATFIVYGMVISLGNTFFIEQADSMRGDISIVLLQSIQWISNRAVDKGYEMIFERRIKRIKKHYSDGVKIGLGMLASIICCAVASSVESKRLKALREEGLSDDPEAKASMPAAWLLLQFFFLGAMEGLAGEGILDFFGHYVPNSRRYGPVFTSSLTGFGAVINIGFIAVLDYYSQLRYKQSWLGDNVNQSRLDSIYRAYTILALLNSFIYAYVAWSYSYDDIIERPEKEKKK
ncbi:hypothetical protein V6N11_050382 [Hibiscus sabdariffa]|uniref:Uncharacterized protein n=1 Tax=Hibiscus sabdariffa TaxID=183260 RepID=A0ABR2TAP5_9ROSI